ncbi:kinase-like domain-containing protein [Immersiella caudata]|uniref:Kinase-like domain-containing protein n=1 Tax=Immersiella caudata TaxID=314043 RepID=A0AA39X5C0_9PEZI|nr:kinase-like domain-containing protein [Immersiella caudata]
MASTIVGTSGRLYVQGEVLRRHHKDDKLSIFKAESGNKSFVFKRVSPRVYDLSQNLAAEFAGSRRLRMHIDCNEKEHILFYPYFRDTLLALIKGDPGFPLVERKKILRRVGEAIQELHGKDWIHIDVKPDNILVNWICDKEGNKTVADVALGDFDIASKLEGGEPCQTTHAIGNVMWRSPEGQTGRVTKASDMFSFGLVCIYVLGGGECLLLNDYQELVKNGISPEQEILIRHFSYFGPVTEGLLQQVNSEDWRNALKGASQIAEEVVMEQPELRFEWWGKELGPEVQNMISGMTNTGPMARTTIDQVLAHPWWQEAT